MPHMKLKKKAAVSGNAYFINCIRTASRNRCRHFRCLSFAGVPLDGQGLPRDAHARYVERSMPRHSSSGLHFCLWLGLIAAACMAARAQERGTGAANANEKEFEALLK